MKRGYLNASVLRASSRSRLVASDEYPPDRWSGTGTVAPHGEVRQGQSGQAIGRCRGHVDLLKRGTFRRPVVDIRAVLICGRLDVVSIGPNPELEVLVGGGRDRQCLLLLLADV